MRRVRSRSATLVAVILLLCSMLLQGSVVAAETPDAPDSMVLQQLSRLPEAAKQAALSNTQLARPKTIFGADNRVQVSPAVATSVQIIVFDAMDVPVGTCSGTIIGLHVVLTAGHCIYDTDLGGFAANFLIIPGADGALSPYGLYEASWSGVPNGWQTSLDEDWDWGILVIPDAIGNTTGWEELAVLSTDSLSVSNLNPYTIGYPADKTIGTQWMTSVPAFDAVTPTQLLHSLDAYGGQSGSGIYRPLDGRVIGVMVGESPSENFAMRVRQDMVASLLDACTRVGCNFSYWIESPSVPDIPTPPAPTTAFVNTWARTDKPVADGVVSRTWMWGTTPFSDEIPESYEQSPDGQRTVVYFDKSRMEITNPDGDPNDLWYVTNGLLVKEMVTGQMQTGDNRFQARGPAAVNVAGDPGDTNGPTYATFAGLLNAQAVPSGSVITQQVNRLGQVSNNPGFAIYGVTAANLVDVPGIRHQVASVFWNFMQSSGTVWENGQYVEAQLFQNPYYATGYPITEPYWTTVQVAGTPHDVLVQCFERRCLTYTPDNPPGWDVEAGNVGQHYYIWRYGTLP